MIATATPASADDFVDACHDFGSAEVVFIGRAISAPITRRVSADREIEKARLAFTAAEHELNAFIALNLPPEIGRARGEALARQATGARDLYNGIQAAHPTAEVSVTPMRVEVPFRGATSADVVMWKGGEPGTDLLDPNRSYLIYATRPFGTLAPDIVSGDARLVENAEAHLRFLNDAAAIRPGGVVYGSLRIEDPADPRRLAPLGGVALRVSIDDRVIGTATRADGTFMVAGLPSGSVRVEPLLPGTLMLPPQALGGSVHGGCLALHMRVKLNGRIRGRVLLDTGAPFHGSVDLVPADRASLRPSSVGTNSGGEFEFNGLPPGSYFLGVNLSTEPAPGVPFRPTYFPGATDKAQASPVLVGAGAEHTDADWVLSSRIGVGSVEVSLDTLAEPQITKGVCIIMFGDDNRAKPGRSSVRTSNDPMIVDVLEGARYRLIAHAETAAGFVESQSFDVIGSAGRQAIRLPVASISQSASASACRTGSAQRNFSASQ